MHMLHVALCVIVLITVCPFPVYTYNDKDDTLELIFTVFRHGDRTNDPATTWPKDQHKNETYYPYGWGQLTNEGKQRMYVLGKKLRKKYGSFLGSCYTPELIDTVSTNVNRTKATLQLVLAGLFPPHNTCMEWIKELNWQPIPYNYLSSEYDHVLTHPFHNCPNYVAVYDAFGSSLEGQKLERKYSQYYPYLSYNTGLNVTKLFDIMYIYFGLTSEKEWGLGLPIWAYDIYPILERAAVDNYVRATATTELKQLSGGFLLNQIIYYSQMKLTNKLIPRNRKIFLYSGHEYNIAQLLSAMEVFTPHIPPYGACIIIEVHTIAGTGGIKIFYEHYTGNEPRPLRLPGCDFFCPFKKFVRLLRKNLAISDNMCGHDFSSLERNSYKRSSYF